METKAAIADRLKTKTWFMPLSQRTKQILIFKFLLCFALIFDVSAQPSAIEKRIGQAELYFDNGSYTQAIEIAGNAVKAAKKANANLSISNGLEITARAQISLQKYPEAESSLSEALDAISDKNETSAVQQRASIFMSYAWLYRSQGMFTRALDYSKKAIELLPNDRRILAEYYLNLGRILYTSGYDLTAIIWLEKAESLLEKEKTSSAKLDTSRFLALAWWAKLNYQTALKYIKKWESAAENTRFKQKYRQALFDSATILSESGQNRAAFRDLEKGLKLATEQKNHYQAGLFLPSLLLNSLDKDEVVEASAYLEQLEKIDQSGAFSFEILLGKAVIAAYKNEGEKSNELFSELDKMGNSSDFILPGWRLKIAKKNKDWNRAIELDQQMLDLTLENNFQDGLSSIHLDFAEAYFHLNKFQLAKEHLEKSLGLIEEIRSSENNRLSLGILETFHQAYRLLTRIKFDQPAEAFELADFLKARLLKDRINNSSLKNKTIISVAMRRKLEELTLKFIENRSEFSEIERTEKLITSRMPELNLNQPDLSGLEQISELNESAIISYFFTLDKKLMAFVWEKDKPLRTVYLPVSEYEVDDYAKTIAQKIKNFIFFKRDGKELCEKLLKPLHISAKHLIIVPDKSLWKIPFQALSSNGEKYLIEEKLISYAPSVSILLEQLKSSKPNRQTLQAFVNSSFENKLLQFVNAEASTVAGIYNSKPIINATTDDFEKMSVKADILHFSMHAEVDNEEPLDSFLGFRKSGSDNGRLTVGELLSIKLKKGSLVFLASCDTNNVLNGEGLVSLAWGMMGSGATTVISAQWEANDKSTAIFTKTFYEHYKQGISSAEALQKSSLELIKNKSGNMHEPYYWAEFTLNGDFR